MKKIGIGYENFKEFTDEKLYYVDKTLLIRDIIEKGGKVTLFTRPRRFGKTLALSMIRTFFELEYDREGNIVDNRRYFEGMKIMDAGEELLSRMGQCPVIKMSLKSAKQPSFYGAFMALMDEIIYEFDRHRYVLGSGALTEEENSVYKGILAAKADWYQKLREFKNEDEKDAALGVLRDNFSKVIKLLSEALEKYHGKKVIILIDEYDVPLENSYFAGFYEEMVGFIRSLFESALKTNDSLEFAVVTGCLRISRESIFTGLNNLKVNSITNEDFAEGFGFVQEETEAMLEHYGILEKKEEVRQWYDGYLFGQTEVYNPWSIISYIDGTVNGKRPFPIPYWANTSSNSIIKEMVEDSDDDTKRELETLMAGGTIEKMIHEDITYGDIHSSIDNLWNFLFFTGYMKKVSERQEGDDIYLTMRIPNREIRSIYGRHINEWFKKIVKNTDQRDLYRAIVEKDTSSIEKILTGQFKKCISTFDSEESFYHGYFLSMLYGMTDYGPKSNREAGEGRPDIILYPENPRDPAYIFELKTRKKFNEMEDGLREAFDQIRDKKYEDIILEEGFAGVVSYGICFCRKSCIAGLYTV